ncbi:hypothetical protein [Chitinophaga sp. 212800010-3]|uniref:hypothetical protein n=1 Tax=unclassified Chitinophaga TaxID=2619133 RepID=UPI002DE540F7|nr:VCBS repeat-containing protein [Chitinophaga sp. 212800010-3]
MKRSILFLAGMIAACHTATTPASQPPAADTVNTPKAPEKPIPATAGNEVVYRDSVPGDFNGDGHTETATLVLVKKGQGNPMEDGTPDEYAVQFSDSTLPVLNIGCCEGKLFNKKDLNKNGTDEICTIQAPPNGNTYELTVWTLDKGKWKPMATPLLLPTGGDPFSFEDFAKRVFVQNDTLYYLETDLNDENLRLVKKPAKLNQVIPEQ